MFRIIDEERKIDMTAKYALGQEVTVIHYQGYRKGVVRGIIGASNSKGTVLQYNVEFYVHKGAAPKIKKFLESHVYANPKEALKALSELEDSRAAENQAKSE